MSGVHVYCIARSRHAAPAGVAGISGAPVRPAVVGPFAVWVSSLERRPEPSVANLRRHNDVVLRAAASESPLPVRFGQWSDSLEALAEQVLRRRDDYEAALDRVRGALEFGVRVLDPELPVGRRRVEPAESGRAYLAGLARRQREESRVRSRGDAVAAALRARLGGRIRGERVDGLPTPHGLVSLAHLVGRGDEDAYRAAVGGLRAEFADLRFLVTGPWPPYSFVA